MYGCKNEGENYMGRRRLSCDCLQPIDRVSKTLNEGRFETSSVAICDSNDIESCFSSPRLIIIFGMLNISCVFH